MNTQQIDTNECVLDERVKVCDEGTGALGLVRDLYAVETKAMKTVVRRHDEGFSVTRYNKMLPLADNVLRVARHQEWRTEMRFDQVHGQYAKDVELDAVV